MSIKGQAVASEVWQVLCQSGVEESVDPAEIKAAVERGSGTFRGRGWELRHVREGGAVSEWIISDQEREHLGHLISLRRRDLSRWPGHLARVHRGLDRAARERFGCDCKAVER